MGDVERESGEMRKRTGPTLLLAMAAVTSGIALAILAARRPRPRPRRVLPLSIEDRLAIEDLIYRYAHFVDSRLAKAWASTFTTDGSLEFVDPRTSAPPVILKGHEALAAFIEAVKEDGSFFSTHFTGNTILTQIAPGLVRGRSMVMVTRRANEETYTPTVIQGVGVYDDEIVKTALGWKFRARRTGNNGELAVRDEFLIPIAPRA